MIPLLPNGNPDNMHWHEYRHVIDSNGDQLIQRVHDGAFIPPTEDCGDYRRYLAFKEKVKAPEEIDLRTTEGQDRIKECEAVFSACHKEHHDRQKAARAAFEEHLKGDNNG